MENATFEEKVSAVLNDLRTFSDFCTQLHTVSRCLLEDCNIGKFTTELARLLKEKKPLKKPPLSIFVTAILKLFKLCLLVA